MTFFDKNDKYRKKKIYRAQQILDLDSKKVVTEKYYLDKIQKIEEKKREELEMRKLTVEKHQVKIENAKRK